MRNLFVILLLLSCTSSLFAQEDRFSNVIQTRGKDVYLKDNSALNVAYTMVDGKVKPIKKIKNFATSIVGKVYAVENDIYNFKKNTYIVLKGSGETILLKEDDAPLYLSSFISKTYWQEKYDSYRNDYVYLNFKNYSQVHSTRATVEYDDLSHIEWRGLEISDDGALYYMCEYNGAIPLEKFKVTSKFFENNKDDFFIKKDDIQPYIDKYNARLAKEKREKEIADSIENSKIRLAKALDEATFEDGDRTINVYKGDTLAIFSYDSAEEKFVARYHYGNLLFKPEKLEFLDTKTTTTEGRYSWERKTVFTSENAEFLKMKGEEGKEQRFIVAADYDDEQTKIWLGELKTAIDNYRKDVAYKKKNQIFITGIGYDYDSNEYSSRFGMYFDVYNCFSKTVKYVEFTMVNYNAVGDVQRDDIGRSSRTVRGIGPIEPGEGGRYSWDDIFWDDRNIIDKTRLTNVKFIFKDGTTKVFHGYSNIKKHMTSDAWGSQ
ncbi:MAG: hypothetical protein J6W24_01110 [Prevotella sp.]|nr:hypothetical protein [Prevotella sp.]